jgi:signal transduction histidine kinase
MQHARVRGIRSEVVLVIALTQLPAGLLIGYILLSSRRTGTEWLFWLSVILTLLASALVFGWILSKRWHVRPVAALAAQVDALTGTVEQQRREIERGQARQRLLAQAGQSLVASLDHERTLNGLAEVAVDQVADWCFIDLLPLKEGETPVRMLAHRDPTQHERLVRLSAGYPIDPLNPSTPVGTAVRTGLSELVPEISPSVLRRFAPDGQSQKLLQELGATSLMIVPLRVGGRSFGALTLGSANGGRRFDRDDLALAEELARKAAVAVDNARLYEAAREELRARARAESELRELNTELEERVRQRTAQLESTNRELEAFSYSVSHDLRSPLRTIDGFSQALLEDYDGQLDEQGRDYLMRVRRGAQTMGHLIDDLLELARITRREMETGAVDLSALAEHVVAELRHNHPDRQVDVNIQPDLRVVGDDGLLRVALANLLGNAWKFTSRTPDARIEFGAQASDHGERTYFVRDNGAGFDMAYASKLFGPFQRLHHASDYEGTGIGLATVQRVISRHGGRAWAFGKVGEGATFYFTLPEAA